MKKLHSIKPMLFSILFCTAMQESLCQTGTHYVNRNSTAPASPYTSWATAASNIQDAVDVAVDGDTVWVTNGTYNITTTITVSNDIEISSVNGPTNTIIDAGNNCRAINLGSNDCVLSGFTVTHGKASSNGGGIYCTTIAPSVTNCIVTYNTAFNGGGMFNGNAYGCIFKGNRATKGGGLSGVIAQNSTITKNTAEYRYAPYPLITYSGEGGGMYQSDAINCIIEDNSVWGGSGGGVADSRVYHCVIKGNRAVTSFLFNGRGGGAYDGTAMYCTILDNSAETSGGGVSSGTAFGCTIFANSANKGGGSYNATLNNCTVSCNLADEGGGMYQGTANNSIIWHNEAIFIGDDLLETTANYSCSPDLIHGVGGSITNDPTFLSTSHIAVDSPCRSAGSTTYTNGLDIDGEAWRDPPSMGCDEYHGMGTVTEEVALSLMGPTNIVTGFPGDYDAYIQGAVTMMTIDFGDGHVITNNYFGMTHAWNAPGDYDVVLSAYNDTYPSGVSVTQAVHVSSIEATTIHVSDASGNDANDGSSWSFPKKTIQAGIDAQDATLYGGAVVVTDGVYAVTAEIAIDKVVQLSSVHGPESTIVDGGGSTRCFSLLESPVIVRGFTVTNGNAGASSGGGIYCNDYEVRVTNCLFTGNAADSGGGMHQGVAMDCVFVNNSADNDGGAMSYVIAQDCTITSNSASNGGGMYNGIANTCTFDRNSASSDGGGIYEVIANNCTFSGNSAISEGGGMYLGAANSCTFTSNSADYSGGGIHDGIANNCTLRGNTARYGGGMRLGTANGCTLSGNSVSFRGGGMFEGTASNCTFSGNSATYEGGGMHSGTANSCTFDRNLASSDGGGMYGGTANDCTFNENSSGSDGGGKHGGTVDGCTLSGNSATNYGGGMYDGTARNCIFSDNSAGSRGGGMYDGTARNCVFSGNSAPSGGGMYLGTANNCTLSENLADEGEGGGMYSGTANNSIIWNNIAPINNDLRNITANYSCSPGLTHGVDGNITNAPIFLSSSHIAINSPCRGAGSATYATGTDIDGEAWLNPPSIGCDEYQGIGTVTGEIDLSLSGPTNIVTGFPGDYDADIQGAMTIITIDFGDGYVITNNYFGMTHAWSVPGNYNVVLSAYNDTYPSGVSVTQMVQVSSAEVTTVHVSDASGNDANDGSSWSFPKKTIQAGIDAQNADLHGGVVLVADGVYSLSEEIAVDKVIQLSSVNGPESTIVDGGGINRCFSLLENTGFISGFTITNGNGGAASGGGIYCNNYDVVVTNCLFTGNTADSGGGMYKGIAVDCIFVGNSATNYGGAMSYGHAYDCTITSNSADKGGGIYSGTAHDCTFDGNSACSYGGGSSGGTANRCTFNANSADSGGGMSSGIANNCTFSSNAAGSNGGGKSGGTANNCIFRRNSASSESGGMHSGTANNCAFIENSANSGGGMRSGMANNCLFESNSANSGGGMIYSTANNCTIIGNMARSGGGMDSGTANNSIIWYNTAATGKNLYTATANYSCSPTLMHGVDGNITNAPIFLSSSHIAVDSPCRGVGSATYASGTDIDGEVWLNPPSVGCDEYHGTGTVTGEIELSLSGPTNIVTGFPGDYDADIQGAVTKMTINFGDGHVITNNYFGKTHTWSVPGNYEVVLSAYNDTYPSGVSVTQIVQVSSVEATAIHVSEVAGNDAYDGLSWSFPKKTIQAGIDAQDATLHGGAVIVTDGVYSVTAEIVIDKVIQLSSVNGPDSTIVDGGGSTRCFSLLGSSGFVRGFTITNGNGGASSGGGIYCNNYNVIVTNCLFTGNVADSGGGMYQGWAIGCDFVNNRAGDYGGAMSYVVAQGCTIISNSAKYGGGMHYGTAHDCTFEDNSASSYGGGMYYGTANNCTFNKNSASSGGGMYRGTANNCTFSGNSVRYSGGGMYYGIANNCTITSNTARYGGGICDATANNCTLSENSASSYGGGMYDGTANNCIVWHNTAPTYGNLRSVTVNYSCSPDLIHAVDGNITNAPLFLDKDAGNYRLTGDSPCINAGNNSYLSTTTDLAGSPRIILGEVDMGAYEWVPPPWWLAKSVSEISTSVDTGSSSFNTSFEVWNEGSSNLTYSLSSDVPWLTLSPTNGSSTGEHDTITAGFDPTGLATGSYTGQITIASIAAFNSPQFVEVVMKIFDLSLWSKSESFEIGMGNWTDSAGYDFNWDRNSGSTPSSGTGPSGAADGIYYIYTESSPNYPSKTAAIEASFDFTGIPVPSLSFDYHMYGATMGSLYVDVFDGIWHSGIWNLTGQQHTGNDDPWIPANVDLSAYGNKNNVTIRFRGITGSSFTSDMAVDNIVLSNGVVSDTDGDGIPDWWEIVYFGYPSNCDWNATCSNGLNTMLEAYVAGLDPTDATSFFMITNCVPLDSGFVIEWPAISGRVYRTLWTDNHTNGFQTLESDIFYPRNSSTDIVHGAQNSGFYQVEVEMQ